MEDIKGNPFYTSLMVQERLDLENISSRTIRRRFHAAGISNYRAAGKLNLQAKHRENRISFALQYLVYNPEDWDNVIWTDEKTFCTDKDGRIDIWRAANTRCQPEHLSIRDRQDRVTASFWGWISANGVSTLVEVGRTMNAERYIDILENNMLPSVRERYSPDQVPIIRYVQDNSAVHTARIVKEWFNQHPDIQLIVAIKIT